MEKRSSSLAVVFGLITILGLAGVIVPWVIPVDLGVGKAVLAVIGGLAALFGVVGFVFTQLYVKASPDRAFVRTGKGGEIAIVNGGSIVIPFLHEIIWVSLKTAGIEVERDQAEALLTSDYLRARIKAKFYVKVDKDENSVKAAAASLGERATDVRALKELIEDKLVGALRTVAAKSTLQELNTDRDKFAEQVQRIVTEELADNGLKLESVTISELDQHMVDPERAKTNVFDAEGTKTATKQIQAARILANEAEREADEAIATRDASARKVLEAQTVIEAKARADAASEATRAKAEADQLAATFAAEQSRLAGEAEAASQRQVELANVVKAKAVEIANVEREQAVAIATVTRNREEEVARRAKEVAIAKAEQERAQAEAEQLLAEEARKKAEEAVVTAKVLAEANRSKEQKVIDEQAAAEQQKIKEEMAADVEAYKVTRKAKAEQDAAEARALAVRTEAEADRDANTLKAEGDQAVQMVPVHVERERVEVKNQDADVEIKLLKERAKYQEVSVELEKALAKIKADAEVGIESAKALSLAFQGAEMNIFGDPTTLTKMSSVFLQGQKVGAFTDGMLEGLPPEIKGLAEVVGPVAMSKLSGLLGGNGKSVDPKELADQVLTIVREGMVANSSANAATREEEAGTPTSNLVYDYDGDDDAPQA